jgi:hypothetical protein
METPRTVTSTQSLYDNEFHRVTNELNRYSAEGSSLAASRQLLVSSVTGFAFGVNDPDPPRYASGMAEGLRRCAAAVARNREPIAEVLSKLLPKQGFVLEISSGTGEHAAYFSSQFPGLDWQPTELDEHGCEGVEAWKSAGSSQLRLPIVLDTRWETWPVERADVVVNINMIHISPWKSCQGLMRGTAKILEPGGLLFLYGPFQLEGAHTAPSNRDFDEWLHSRDPAWGVRDLAEVTAEAERNGLVFEEKIEMPANNLSVIFKQS